VRGTALQFHGSSERKHRTKVVTIKELKSIQKFTVIIITWFLQAPQPQVFDAGLNWGVIRARQRCPLLAGNLTMSSFWESEKQRNLLFFQGTQ